MGVTEYLTHNCFEDFYFFLTVFSSSGLGFGWRGTLGWMDWGLAQAGNVLVMSR